MKFEVFEKVANDQQKYQTTISVFNNKMKMFERMYLNKKNEEAIEKTEE